MKMSEQMILTNDDGVASPLLGLTLQVVEQFGKTVVVVPEQQQSWKAKAITRFSTLSERTFTAGRFSGTAIAGTPADCVNIGIYHLCKSKPPLVVSGMNIGINAGLGFSFSSGTLGACFEANIAGIPALALSQAFEDRVFEYYSRHEALPEDVLSSLELRTVDVLTRVLKPFFSEPEFFSQPITWSINLPVSVSRNSLVRMCSLADSRYGSCFKRDKKGFFHSLDDVFHDMRPSGDVSALSQGYITVTPVDLRVLGQVSAQEVRGLERHFESKR